MQILKDEVRESILQASLKLFLQHGFERTTAEKIAERARVSKSNLYNYFKSKDEIFGSLTDAAAAEFTRVIEKFAENGFAPKFDEPGFDEMMADAIFELIQPRKDELLLLSLRAKGTKYEGLTERLADMIAAKFMRDYGGCFSEDDPIARIIAHGLFNGIITTAVYSRSDSELHCNLRRLVRYHGRGFAALVQPDGGLPPCR